MNKIVMQTDFGCMPSAMVGVCKIVDPALKVYPVYNYMLILCKVHMNFQLKLLLLEFPYLLFHLERYLHHHFS